jgi:hypothetical protein
MRETWEQATAEPEEERCGLEAGATKSGPQMLMLRLRKVGHQGSEAEAFSDAEREKM